MRGIQQFAIAVGGTGIIWGLGGVAVYADTCPLFLTNEEHYNTFEQGKIVVLGQLSNHHYVVVVPGDRPRDFQSIQQCIPDAFIARNRLGKYIHVGSFLDYIMAKRLETFLRSRKLDARVVYFREG